MPKVKGIKGTVAILLFYRGKMLERLKTQLSDIP
jgi:hypothetical protein